MKNLATGILVLSSSTDFTGIVKPIIELFNSIVGPALGIVGALGVIYCIILGVRLAKAEEPQEREKAKVGLKNAIIGFLLIFILIVALNVSMKPLLDWVNKSASTSYKLPTK